MAKTREVDDFAVEKTKWKKQTRSIIAKAKSQCTQLLDSSTEQLFKNLIKESFVSNNLHGAKFHIKESKLSLQDFHKKASESIDKIKQVGCANSLEQSNAVLHEIQRIVTDLINSIEQDQKEDQEQAMSIYQAIQTSAFGQQVAEESKSDVKVTILQNAFKKAKD